MAFDLKALKPAATFEDLGAAEKGGALTVKAAALRNIDGQLALIDVKKEGKRTFWDTVIDGKRSYAGTGKSIGFSIKVGAAKLTLGGTQEPGVAKTDFEATLRGIKEAINAGALDQQFAELDKARTARTDKMKATRASKLKKEKPKA